ncbi:histone acetyltransferase [Exophiala viscosa]|uniref:histone acetyltransferase n=1 Tax=Exophiala viscosa TaxID=2486360 RepID=UPI0021A102B4|nr:histone acetyltransferase [Exophiala viscosa]
MPPLVSEDPDEVSSLEQDSAAPTAPSSPRPDVSENAAEGSVEADIEIGNETTASIQNVHQATEADHSSHAPNPDDSALGDQLQRSAEEGLSDAEAEPETGPTPQTDVKEELNEDVSMLDADADADREGSGEVSGNTAQDAETDLDADADADADADMESEEPDQETANLELADHQQDEEHAQDDGATNKADPSKTSQTTPDDEPDSSEDEAEDTETSRSECIFCKKSSAGEEGAEADLICSSCDSQAHLRCAKEKEVVEDEDTSTWRCPDCVKKPASSESPQEQAARSKNSAPRLVRDLLPVTRGVQRPNAHSIFAQPLIEEGEDGGRALRKRKSPSEPPTTDRRRRKATPRAQESATAAETKAEAERAVAHSTRRSSQKISRPIARILQHRPFEKAPPHKFILAFRLDQSKIEEILSRPPRPGKRRGGREKKKIPKIEPPIFQPPVPKFPALPTHNLIFPSAFTDREAEINAKPYGGILSEAEADTSRSLPQLRDREIFEIARKEAEEERRRTSAAAEAEINGDNTAIAKPNRTVSGPPTKIKCIQFGKFVIDTFYAAPYPEEYSHESRLFICEFCLKYLPSEFVAYRHKLKCPAKHPPGDEIYRDGTLSVWEVDGRKKTEYCQCLCLMAKMFLGSKTLYYDVEPFLFYILTEYDEFGYHFVGYFSKEKRPASQNNVSCILVMPIHQRKGYATFLIDFSYLLTRIEGKDGSPEKPLSDMGLTAYRSYWDLTVSRHLLDIGVKPFSTKSLMARTGMTADDVIHTLERLYAFIRDPVTKTYGIRYDKKLYERVVEEFDSKKHRKLRPQNLVWTPYIMGRSDQATLDGQPLHAMAPRDDEDDEEENVDGIDATTKADQALDAEIELSPKSKTKSIAAMSRPASVAGDEADVKDPSLVNDQGVVAPGPPSTDALNGTVSTQVTQPEVKVNGLVNGDSNVQAEKEADKKDEPVEEPLSGYALAFRTLAIPPARFQIDPPIPPAMLRQRSTKKRTQAAAFGQKANGIGLGDSPSVPVAVRSSPRNAPSINGSASGTRTGRGSGSRLTSPDKMPDTPVRRSGRRSRLSNTVDVASANIDGAVDDDEDEDVDDDQDADVDVDVDADADEDSAEGEGDDDVQASVKQEGQSESEAQSESESDAEADAEDEDVSVAEGSVQEDEDDDDDNDEDAEIPEDDEDSSSEDEDDPDAEVDLPDDDDDEDEDAEVDEEDDDDE